MIQWPQIETTWIEPCGLHAFNLKKKASTWNVKLKQLKLSLVILIHLTWKKIEHLKYIQIWINSNWQMWSSYI